VAVRGVIAALLPKDDTLVADFWVAAWQATMPEIDFEARRPWILEHLAHMRDSGQVVRGHYLGNEIQGFYTLFPATGLIEQICVRREAAGQGIGAHLIEDAETFTRAPLNLVVNADNNVARRFYEKLGFVDLSTGVSAMSGLVIVSMARVGTGERL
jgi:putative acetyltransferase